MQTLLYKKQILGYWYNMDEDSSNASNPCCEDVNEFQKYLADQNITKDETPYGFGKLNELLLNY